MHLIFFPLIYCRRSGSHKAHITFEHIPELWEFIQRIIPNEISDSFDNTWIIIHLEHHTIFDIVLCHQLFLPLFRIHIHTSEFVNVELLTIFTDSHLFEEDRSR